MGCSIGRVLIDAEREQRRNSGFGLALGAISVVRTEEPGSRDVSPMARSFLT